RLAAAVDPQAFLRGQHPAATTEVPRRSVLGSKDRTHAAFLDGRLNSRREVKTDRICRRFTDLLAAFGDELIRAAQFLAVIPEHETAFVRKPERPNVAVMAGLQPA